jgi:hypothetical protein
MSFLTADEARVVVEENGELKDVPADGKTVGEIVTRGNIVMREVRISCQHREVALTYVTVLPRP